MCAVLVRAEFIPACGCEQTNIIALQYSSSQLCFKDWASIAQSYTREKKTWLTNLIIIRASCNAFPPIVMGIRMLAKESLLRTCFESHSIIGSIMDPWCKQSLQWWFGNDNKMFTILVFFSCFLKIFPSPRFWIPFSHTWVHILAISFLPSVYNQEL